MSLLNEARPLAPFYGWTRSDYYERLQRTADHALPSPSTRTPPGPLAALLAAVGDNAAWHRDALCREYPDVDWFPTRDVDEPKAICARCLVRAECLTSALDNIEAGIWGATSERERRAIRARGRAA